MVLLAVLGARAMVAELQPALGGDYYALQDSQHGPLHNTSIGSSRAWLLARATMYSNTGTRVKREIRRGPPIWCCVCLTWPKFSSPPAVT